MSAQPAMQARVLAPLFDPRTLLVVADRPLPVAQALPAALRQGFTQVDCAPGEPPELPAGLAGVPAGGAVDLALVCLAPALLPQALERLAAARPRAAVLLPHEIADDDPERTLALCRAWAREHRCALLGPNSFGLQRPHAGLNLSRHPLLAHSGKVALVAQSRAIMAAVMDWAEDVQIGFSAALALGDEAVLGLPEVLDFLAGDPRTDSIALYVEDVGFAREFMSALRAAASVKPVVVLRAGRARGPAAADAVFDAALRRAGAVRVRYFVQLFSALKVLGYVRRPLGRRIALFSNGSGPPQLALDLMGDEAPVLPAQLSPPTALALAGLLEPGAASANPVISHAPLTPAIAREALRHLLDDPAVDGVLVLLAPDARCDMAAVADCLAELAPRARKPVITCFMGDATMRPLRRRLDAAGTPAFRTPESAADAFGVLATHHYNQQLLLQAQPPVPPGRAPDLAAARAVLDEAAAQGRRELDAGQCRRLLAAFDVPVQIDAQAAAAHRQAGDAMPEAAIRLHTDARFGPVLRFGAGGPAAELAAADRGMDLPPLNGYLARQLIARSRIWRRALGRRASPAVLEALQAALVRVSELASELPAVQRLELDPLYAAEGGLVAGAACVVLGEQPGGANPQAEGYPHMAIHPYPSNWVQQRRFDDGTPWLIRPIRPEDAEPLQTFTRGLSERSRYMRFVSMMRELTPRMLARYTQVDYHRELALVATVQLPNPAHRGHPHEVIVGLAHYLRNPDGRGAEYALVVGDDWQRRGLGGELMKVLIAAAREQGLAYIEGFVLAGNRPMLGLMTRLGFANDPDPEDPAMRRVWLGLDEAGKG